MLTVRPTNKSLNEQISEMYLENEDGVINLRVDVIDHAGIMVAYIYEGELFLHPIPKALADRAGLRTNKDGYIGINRAGETL